MGVQDFIAAPFMTWVNVEINLRTLEALSPQLDGRVLEVGPGPCDLMERIAVMFARGSVTGVDFSPEMIYFWPDPAAVFREFWRVLRTGGRLVVSFFPAVAME